MTMGDSDTGQDLSFLHDIPRGLVMPAEWAPHEASFILYPHNVQTFRLEPAQRQVMQVAKAIALQGKEKVYLLAKDEEHASQVKQHLNQEVEDSIVVRVCPSNDTWVRDTGPTCCWNTSTANHELVGVDWDFNAYGGPDGGGCYWPCDLDRQITRRLCSEVLDIPSLSVPLILEGGSIHTDGEGTLLVTKECLLNPNRNPQLDQSQIESILQSTLGVSVVIWLPLGLDADEDTNGHVDNFCCFVRPGHVVLAWTDDETGDAENYRRCRQAQQVLEESVDAKGRKLEIHKLILPPPLFYSSQEAESLQTTEEAVERQEDQKLAASYVNFYIANEAVIVPQFGVPHSDQQAMDTLQELFDRRVVGVQSREILLGGGNIHCITQQVPARPKV